jgi:hypothetical protein
MDVYSQVTSDSTLRIVEGLGERLEAIENHHPPAPLLYLGL